MPYAPFVQIHPAMHTHPTFVPPSDGSMIQGASPLYANFVPPTQVGGYAGMNTGFAGNTYLPDQQAPYSHNLGGGGGLVNPVRARRAPGGMAGAETFVARTRLHGPSARPARTRPDNLLSVADARPVQPEDRRGQRQPAH
jgi:hypothetical protein